MLMFYLYVNKYVALNSHL